ncbi:hypothetical protein ACFLSH_04110, partial [Bacteroidota bacterium]
MPKLFKISLILFTLVWCFTLTAQQNALFTDADPYAVTQNFTDTPGDILAAYDIDALTGETGNLGCEYAFGYLWVTARGIVDPVNKLWKIDISGTPVVVASYPQGNTDAWGWRDLCSDGTYLYASVTNLVEQIDPATGLTTGVTIPGPIAPNRALAYDPATDHFWTASFTSPLYEFDRTGTVINTFPSVVSMYGAGWDDYTAGGPWLWVNGDPGTTISQVDPVTGLATGLSYPVGGGSDGGLDIDQDLYPGLVVGVSMMQATPDSVIVVEIDASSGGGTFSDEFDSYTAGVQLVAQNNVDWDTWSGGGGTAEDPFVSNAFSYSGSNSVVEIPGNDFIKRHGDKTTGKWYMSFFFYIQAANSGYFNTMNDFDGTFVWGMDTFFDVGGGGRVDTTGGGGGGANDVNFTWAIGQWNQALIVWDLDATPPVAEFWTGTDDPLTLVATWDFTQGGTKPTQLAVNDFYGGASTDEMYIDNYTFGDIMPQIVPVELSSFTANVNNGVVELNWTTATETNNQGFDVEKNSGDGFQKIGFVPGFGTSTDIHNYSYVDGSVEEGTYSYRLKQVDYDGTFEYSNAVEVDITVP